MFKAAAADMPSYAIRTPQQLFGDDFFRQIVNLDFRGDSGALDKEALAPTDWFLNTAAEFRSFNDAAERLLQNYILFLENNTIELFESLANSNSSSFMAAMPTIRRIRKEGNGIFPPKDDPFTPFSDAGTMDLLKEYTLLLISLANYYNSRLPKSDQIVLKSRPWDSDVSPGLGSSRCESGGDVLRSQPGLPARVH
ncbi:MAG TPA: hypothetical protein VGH33_08580, partial [Isosphaeraceae bacterium]